MAVYERGTVVAAPLDEVWEFHSRASGLEAVSPGWMNLRVESVEGPDGERDPELLETGSTIRASMRPFGVGPRQQWISDIVTRQEGNGEALFRDEMTRGPFPYWMHTHRFEAVPDGTRVHDHVKYRLPGGPLGRLAGPAGWLGFEPMFRYRHWKTKQLLE